MNKIIKRLIFIYILWFPFFLFILKFVLGTPQFIERYGKMDSKSVLKLFFFDSYSRLFNIIFIFVSINMGKYYVYKNEKINWKNFHCIDNIKKFFYNSIRLYKIV